jgi:F0F1-type ATP synthase membrane subunit c/vacuolar-type H+-ATPase subunit K
MAMAESLVIGLVYLNSCFAVDGAGNPKGLICANATEEISREPISNLNLFIIMFFCSLS